MKHETNPAKKRPEVVSTNVKLYMIHRNPPQFDPYSSEAVQSQPQQSASPSPSPPLFAVKSCTFHPSQSPSDLLQQFIAENAPYMIEESSNYYEDNYSNNSTHHFFPTNNQAERNGSKTNKAAKKGYQIVESDEQDNSRLPSDLMKYPVKHKNTDVFIVKFKYFCKEYVLGYGAPGTYQVGDMVIVAADRGDDMGTIVEILSIDEFYRNRPLINTTAETNASGFVWTGPIAALPSLETTALTTTTVSADSADSIADNTSPAASKREFLRTLGRILRLAADSEIARFHQKTAEENDVIKFVESLIEKSSLKMHVVDAEFQFNMNKLTIYYTTEDNMRIDFRDMVKSIFTVYKVRIWMERV